MRPPRQGNPNAEPLLEDMLADPIVHSVMRRDRVDPKELFKLISEPLSPATPVEIHFRFTAARLAPLRERERT